MAGTYTRAHKRRAKPTKRIRDRLDLIRDTVLGSQDEWPMRVRRVFYVMMGHGTLPDVPAKNASGKGRTGKQIAAVQYQYLVDDLARLRVMRELPWKCIDDTHRRIMEAYSSETQEVYMRGEVKMFLADYKREHYMHAPYYPEIWIEKDAATTVFEPLAESLRIPLVILKGDSSITFVHKGAERARERMAERDQPTLIVYVSDLDPKGYFMLDNVMGCLHNELDIDDEILGARALLTPEQVVEFNLPHNPAGLSTGDSRYNAYVEAVGDFGVELDALDRSRSHAAVQSVIDEHCGADFLEDQRQIEETELAEIATVREDVIEVIEEAIE